MTCPFPSPIFPSPFNIGINEIHPQRDGYTVYAVWKEAVSSITSYTIGYNIYFSTDISTVFSDGPKYFTLNKSIYISRFVPGNIIYFGVRATEFDPNYLNLLGMTPSLRAKGGYVYPETILAENIDTETSRIPLIDVSEFPTIGMLKIGIELIQYSNVDYVNNII